MLSGKDETTDALTRTVQLRTKMMALLAALTIFSAVLMPIADSADADVPWCYHDPICNDTIWISRPYGVCNGTRQSPINIETAKVKGDSNLTAFSFTGFDNNSTMKKIKNTGKTVKVDFADGLMSVSGGGLPNTFNSLQFHLHWGNGSSSPGSEHTVDDKRYPMELHIVNLNSKFNGDIAQIVEDSEGIAALGFFIEATNEPGPESWKTLTKYLSNLTHAGDYANITDHISVDELLVGVDRTRYYRYLGSLTTPKCQEAVVWTVFKDTVKVNKDLIDLFSTTIFVNSSSNSPLMTNVYRNIVPTNNRVVTSQPAPAPASAVSKTSSTVVLLFFAMLSLLHMG
ncbi:hypothetical protein AGOR_G00093590 [Albula goreensis]|uniref:Carbonic anhydrase n=1 Tax=Albula goreensis TaxID=1534307 RepID=A0A8T3DIS1_9TELE|nr:hypothetical protein AGOR_G00093590 [Albula goreensis]